MLIPRLSFVIGDPISIPSKVSALRLLKRFLTARKGFSVLYLCFFLSESGCSPADWPFAMHPLRTDDVSAKVKISVPQPYRIEITGRQFQWQVRYPGFDGVLATKDDIITGPNVHVPENTEIVFELKSSDYVYLLSLPQLRLKEIAVPGLDFSLTLCPGTIGEFDLQGDDLCGDLHPEMSGRLIVESRPQFERWLRQQTATTNGNQLD